MNSTNKKIITRFAPSPTGLFHVGSARTALYNYLFAQKNDGVMLLRFEDTDTERSKKEYENDIVEALGWLGIKYGSPARQSERTSVYSAFIKKLINDGKAYISEEEGKRSEIIRFKNPNKKITFDDTVRGDITFDTTELGDFIIARGIEEPLYHLAVVIDDYEMEVTHIIRGEEHISNTPRQSLIQEAIGASRPAYVHIPLILGPDRSKLSKRHGAKSVNEFRKEGYLPEALLNYLALLGWSPGNDREIFRTSELFDAFSLEGIQKAGAIFNIEKLKWVNRQHLLALSEEVLGEYVEDFIPQDIKKLPNYSKKMLTRVLSVIRERIETLDDVRVMGNEGELEYYFEKPEYFKEGLLWKEEDPEKALNHLSFIYKTLETIEERNFLRDVIRAALWDYATEQGRGDVLWPMRFALSGRERSPDPFELAGILEKKETLERIKKAQDILK